MLKFGDGSEIKDKDVPEDYKEAVKMKYNMEWDDYIKMVMPKIEKLWKEGKVLTKFGVMKIEEYEKTHGKIETQAEHFFACVYSDLRAALMAIILRKFGKEAKVIALTEEGERVYE